MDYGGGPGGGVGYYGPPPREYDEFAAAYGRLGGSLAGSSPFSNDSNFGYVRNHMAAAPSASAAARESILKNGTLPRAHYPRTRNGVLDRMNSDVAASNYYNDTAIDDVMDVMNGVGVKSPLLRGGGGSNGNLNRVSGEFGSNGSAVKPAVNGSAMKKVNGELENKPIPRSASSNVIKAQAHRPLCADLDCLGGDRQGTTSGEDTQTAPIGVLFSIFLMVSLVVVSGIMVYLRGGTKESCCCRISSVRLRFFAETPYPN
jgi:hypothetical protein